MNRQGRERPWEFNEWFHGQSGRPMGFAGQSWSAAMYLFAHDAVVNGQVRVFIRLTAGGWRVQGSRSLAARCAGEKTVSDADHFTRLSEHLYRFEGICNVYVVVGDGPEPQVVLIDFGGGDVLDYLPELGVTQPGDILMTHHHRDQAQGLPRAAEGWRIWCPGRSRSCLPRLIASGRSATSSTATTRQDRFSLLYSAPHHRRSTITTATVWPVRPSRRCPRRATPRLVSYLAEIDGQRVVFSGDLIAAPGKLWSLAATQWTYNGAEGIAATILSVLDLKERGVDLLLPSHGAPMDDLPAAIDLLVERLWELLQYRQDNRRLFQWRENPFVEVTPHLLFNQTSVANSYVLLSEAQALFLDFGFDFSSATRPAPTALGAGRGSITCRCSKNAMACTA